MIRARRTARFNASTAEVRTDREPPGRLWRESVGALRPYWRRDVLVVFAVTAEIAYWTLVPLVIRVLIDNGLTTRDVDLMVRALALLAIAFVAAAVVSTARVWLAADIGVRYLTDTRARLLEHLQRLSADYYGRAQVGDLLNRLSADLNTIETALTIALPDLVWGVIQILITVPLLFLLDWHMALVALVAVPLAMVGPRVLAPRVAAASYLRKQAEGQLLGLAQQLISGHAVIRAFSLEPEMLRRLREQLAQLGILIRRDSFQARLVGRTTTYGSQLGQLLVFAVGAVLVFGGDITVGMFVGFIGLLLNVSDGIRWLSLGLPDYLRAAGAFRRVGEVLAEVPRTGDIQHALPLPRLARDIRLEQVTFSYDGSATNLDAVSLTIPAGTRVALVGPSGSGKSTVLNLIARFYDPDVGAVLFDGHDIRSASQVSLRAQSALVLQDTFLFSGTIRDNIRLGRLEATDAEIASAARAAQIDDLVASLPNGYETDVGERGNRLSGGQRQRIALARALLRDPQLLLLDEATSALDPGTEAAFNDTLTVVTRGRTVISVTHRLAGLTEYDQIFVLAEGKLIEQGSHASLLALGGLYAQLWAQQSGFTLDTDARHAEVSPERLRAIPLFAELDSATLERLMTFLVSEHVAAGRVIIGEGTIADRFYLLVRGTVEASENSNGSRRVLRRLRDGNFFGEIALLAAVPRTATVTAITDCLLLSLAAEHFRRLLESSPGVRATVDRTALERGYVAPGSDGRQAAVQDPPQA